MKSVTWLKKKVSSFKTTFLWVKAKPKQSMAQIMTLMIGYRQM